MASDPEQLEGLVAAVQHSAKYRSISPELIAAIGRRELITRRNIKEAIKATKGRLHQVCGAFLAGEPRYAEWLRDLSSAVEGDGIHALRPACMRIMQHHVSTRERLPILEDLYGKVLSQVTSVCAVIDIGCGLHPLALPWMALPPDVVYRCYDADARLVDFLNGFFCLTGIRGEATVCDVVTAPPHHPADVAMVLKVLPTLEQIEPGAGAALLRALPVPYMLVSFPAQSLGGRHKGMAQHYDAQFSALAQREGWRVQRFAFATELVFLVDKGQRAAGIVEAERYAPPAAPQGRTRCAI